MGTVLLPLYPHAGHGTDKLTTGHSLSFTPGTLDNNNVINDNDNKAKVNAKITKHDFQ